VVGVSGSSGGIGVGVVERELQMGMKMGASRLVMMREADMDEGAPKETLIWNPKTY